MLRRLTITLIALAAAIGTPVYLWLSFPSGMLETIEYVVLDSQVDTLNSTGPPTFRVAQHAEELRRIWGLFRLAGEPPAVAWQSEAVLLVATPKTSCRLDITGLEMRRGPTLVVHLAEQCEGPGSPLARRVLAIAVPREIVPEGNLYGMVVSPGFRGELQLASPATGKRLVEFEFAAQESPPGFGLPEASQPSQPVWRALLSASRTEKLEQTWYDDFEFGRPLPFFDPATESLLLLTASDQCLLTLAGMELGPDTNELTVHVAPSSSTSPLSIVNPSRATGGCPSCGSICGAIPVSSSFAVILSRLEYDYWCRLPGTIVTFVRAGAPWPTEPDGHAVAHDGTSKVGQTVARTVERGWRLGTCSGLRPTMDPRKVESEGEPFPELQAALLRTLQGESGLYDDTWFSEKTAGMLNRVTILDGVVVVDLGDLSTVIPAKAVANDRYGRVYVELVDIVFQFDRAQEVMFELNGSCTAFWDWLVATPRQCCKSQKRADWGSK